MFMMPYLSRITRTHFPVAVILLVLINAIVFFGPQSLDRGRYERMAEYYGQSVLPNIELPAYVEYLKRSASGQTKTRDIERWMREGSGFRALRIMEADKSFMRDLRDGKVISEQHPQFWEWQQARRHFEDLNASVFSERFHFDTGNPRLVTAITHQFLHGDTGHIVGNMIVLALVGPAVEALLGAPGFLVLYLVGGVAAAASHMLIGHAGGGLLGASGAISGVMGAFAVLLGMRRIPFFYFVFVYFDVIRAPALLALPIWLINEAAQLLWLGNEHVAYGAHFGGLAAGALLAAPFRKRAARKLESSELLEEKTPSPATEGSVSALYQARRLMKAQRFDEARVAYARAAIRAQTDVPALRECLNVVKLSPTSAEFTQIAAHVLAQRSTDPALHALILELFRECTQKGRAPLSLDPQTMVVLVQRFSALRCFPELERTVRLMHETAPSHPLLPKAIAHAVQSLRQGGDPSRAAELLRLQPRPLSPTAP